jgi:hypothetical protein
MWESDRGSGVDGVEEAILASDGLTGSRLS